MGSLGWRAAKWAAILYNQTVVVRWGQYTGRLVQGLALVAVEIQPQEIADGCYGQELTATTMRFRVDQWAEMLRQPCFLGDTQQRGQNQSTKKAKK